MEDDDYFIFNEAGIHTHTHAHTHRAVNTHNTISHLYHINLQWNLT
mgnify:CR=1 FL=1